MPTAGSASAPTVPTVASSQLLRVEDVARRLDCSIPSVNRLRKAGKLPPAMKIGNLVRWSPEIIDEWLASERGRASAARSSGLMDRVLASMETSADPFIRAMGKAFAEHGERFTILHEPGDSAAQAEADGIQHEPSQEYQS